MIGGITLKVMVNMWYNIIAIFLTLIIIHELGHIFAYLCFGYNPDVKLKWWGILIGEKIIDDIKINHMGFIYLAGILAGYFFIFFYNNIYWNLVYVIMCFVDINGLLEINGIEKKYFKLTIREYKIIQAKKILNKLQ